MKLTDVKVGQLWNRNDVKNDFEFLIMDIYVVSEEGVNDFTKVNVCSPLYNTHDVRSGLDCVGLQIGILNCAKSEIL